MKCFTIRVGALILWKIVVETNIIAIIPIPVCFHVYYFYMKTMDLPLLLLMTGCPWFQGHKNQQLFLSAERI